MTQINSNNSETWNVYYPVNSTVYNPSNIVRLRIPKSSFVADFSRAFISLRYNLPYSWTGTNDNSSSIEIHAFSSNSNVAFTNNPSSDSSRTGFLVNQNAGAIFDIIEMTTDGRTLYHDDFSQTSVTLNALNKGEDYINSFQQTFVNPMKEINATNNELSYKNLLIPGNYQPNTKLISSKNIIIPLSLLFPCFEHANDWPCFMINDTLEFNLYVSRAYKYLVDYLYINQKKINAVRPISNLNETNQVKYLYYSTSFSTTFYLDELSIDNIMLHIPGHVPSESEYAEINSIINDTTGYMYTFRHWNVINYLSRYLPPDELPGGGQTLTQQVNFNATTNNMFGVAMLALRPGTEVFFDKPAISTIQVNLGSWELASNGTHLGDNYRYGGDMLQSVLDNLGQTNLQYYDVVQESLIHDHALRIEDALFDNQYYPTGSYMTYWDASPYNELGVGANEFSNLITYKYSVSRENTGEWPVPNTLLQNAKTYCCINTCSGLSITSRGIECINPNSRMLSSDFINRLYDYSDDYSFRGPHGIVAGAAALLPKVIGFIPKIFTGIVNGVKGIVNGVRGRLNRKHMAWYRERLTEEEMNKYMDQLTHDSYYVFPRAWKKTYKKIIAARNQSHGLLLRHGLKVRDMSLIPLGPGYKNTPWSSVYRRPRLTSGRLINWNGGFNTKIAHGLCNTGHGLRSWWKRLWMKVKTKLFKYGSSGLDQGKNIIRSLLEGKITLNEAKTLGKQLLKYTGIDIMNDIQNAAMSEHSHGLPTHMLEKWRIKYPNRARLFYNLFSKALSPFKFRHFAKQKYLTTFPIPLIKDPPLKRNPLETRRLIA